MRDVIAGIAAAVVPRQHAVLASAGTETTFGSFWFTDTVSPYVFVLIYVKTPGQDLGVFGRTGTYVLFDQ